SDKALKIMIATTVMGVIVLGWCALTLIVRGPSNPLPSARPDLHKKVEYEVVDVTRDRVTGEELETARHVWKRQGDGTLVPKEENGKPVPKLNEIGREEDPLGFLPRFFPKLAAQIREPRSWWNIIGVIGILIAFGHSILAMSGEETLAQVYR